MNFIRSMFFVVVLCVSSGSVATAQDFDKGVAAYQAGDFATALQEFLPLAEGRNSPSRLSLADRIANSQSGMPGANVSHERMRAENYLGIMHQLGQGVLQDDVQAVRWFRLAAGHGYASAQESLGGMIQAGNGVLQDDEEAVKWYRMAAEQGHASAQYKLGLMFSTSQSSVQDNVRAHMWYNISVANGSALGGERRDEIVDEMTPADVSKAQAMARECMSSGYEDCGWGWGWW